MPAPAPFVRQVRHALTHLYDPDALRSHPLLAALRLTNRSSPHSALRELLLKAIEALKPEPGVPVSSHEWRAYRVLMYRYVQQFDQEQTAHQLGVGTRHVRREQRAAVQTLADALFAQGEAYHQEPGTTCEAASHQLENELAWLKAEHQGTPAALGEALQAALQLVAPLAERSATRLEPPVLPSLPPVAIHPSALRQAAVSVATSVIRRVPGGKVRFSAEHVGQQVRLVVTAAARGLATATSEADQASIEAARAILGMYGGHIETSGTVATLSVALTLPAAGALDVLLLDDNDDIAQLFARYLVGTRYRLRHATTVDGFFDSLEPNCPQIIILDVMIPGIDGWEILGRLRQHPRTDNLPIIVCTILPERDLALALGATAFLRKPVTRQALLAALREVLGEELPASH